MLCCHIREPINAVLSPALMGSLLFESVSAPTILSLESRFYSLYSAIGIKLHLIDTYLAVVAC